MRRCFNGSKNPAMSIIASPYLRTFNITGSPLIISSHQVLNFTVFMWRLCLYGFLLNILSSSSRYHAISSSSHFIETSSITIIMSMSEPVTDVCFAEEPKRIIDFIILSNFWYVFVAKSVAISDSDLSCKVGIFFGFGNFFALLLEDFLFFFAMFVSLLLVIF